MRRIVFLSSLALAVLASTAAAQKPTPTKASEFAGNWEMKSMIGPKDSVIATYVLHATSTEKGWTLTFTSPKRDALPLRIIAMGGDSVVTEMGPYKSVLRAGVMVTVRSTSHVKGDTMAGTFTSKYANGDVVNGKDSGTRKK